LAKPNYNFQKRQKELARQKKKEEKKQRKLEKSARPEEGQEAVSGNTQQEAGAAEVAPEAGT
jgi:hypothetical protein